MTTDIQTCDTHPLGPCGACERPARRKEEVELGIASPLRHLIGTGAVAVIEHPKCEHCLDAKGCPSNLCTRHHCRNCGVGELKTDICPELEATK